MTAERGHTRLLRVRDWNALYENNRSRELTRTEWYPAPNDLSADSYVELISDPDGAAHLGVWSALLMVASRARPRGQLVRDDGRTHTPESLSRVTRLPQPLIQNAIERLLEMRLLETVEQNARKKNNIRSQHEETMSHARARGAHADAVEGNGKEHHHQEQKRRKKKRTEPASADPDSNHACSPRAASEKDATSVHGYEEPHAGYASAEDELKTIYESKTGRPISIELLDAIRNNLNAQNASMDAFVAEVREHVQTQWRNPAGFIRDLSKYFRKKTAVCCAPVTAAEAALKDYRCEICGSRTLGEGARVENGKAVPCFCASPEYVARQSERGVFSDDAPNQTATGLTRSKKATFGIEGSGSGIPL